MSLPTWRHYYDLDFQDGKPNKSVIYDGVLYTQRPMFQHTTVFYEREWSRLSEHDHYTFILSKFYQHLEELRFPRSVLREITMVTNENYHDLSATYTVLGCISDEDYAQFLLVGGAKITVV